MDKNITNHLEQLKTALLKLDDTGEKGFEGLIAVVLTKISGIPFRIAASGSQHGVDAKPVYDSDVVSFEAKHYSGSIPKDRVLTKIAELSIEFNRNVDLWILGTTTSVSTQLADTIRDTSARLGVTTFILDWSEVRLPPLGVALAETKDETTQFLELNIQDASIVKSAQKALEAISRDDAFKNHIKLLRTQIHQPTIGAGLLQKANHDWLQSVFSNRTMARQFLGQHLSPQDYPQSITVERAELIENLSPFFSIEPKGNIAVVHGNEGVGKSWLVAQSWLSLDKKPLMIILTPEDLYTSNVRENIETIIINKLIVQTSDHSTDTNISRWRRRLEFWRKNKFKTQNLIVFVDGLNQKPKIDWALVIESLGAELDKLSGKLIITCRTNYYQEYIERRLSTPKTHIFVPEWNEIELDSILNFHGIKRNNLAASVLFAIKNPRLLGIALELLSTEQIESFDQLNVSRILFEHIRASERDSPVLQNSHEFSKNLQKHADKILERLLSNKNEDLTIFEGNLQLVAEGSFFQPVEGDPTLYFIKEEGLTLALGFSIIDSLRKSYRNQNDPEDSLRSIIEPVAAIDKTADVVIAAITIAILDETCPTEFTETLICHFVELQNPNFDDYKSFVKFAKKKPEAFMLAAYSLCLKDTYPSNLDWLTHALLDAKTDNKAWTIISEHIRNWLNQITFLIEDSRNTFRSEQEEQERTIKQQTNLDKSLDELSPVERNILNSINVVDNFNLYTLYCLALTLMKDKPLSGFTTSFLNWCFAHAINPYTRYPYEQFINLVRLNCIDWKDTYIEIHNTIKVLENNDISNTGKWTLVYLLSATGEIQDGEKAERIAEELVAHRAKSDGWRLIEDYCATDPCDPNSIKPKNIANTAKYYRNIDVSLLRTDRSTNEVDLQFEMGCTGLARFAPNTVIAKHIEFGDDVIKRNGFQLLQGILDLRNSSALLNKTKAMKLLKHTQRIDSNVEEVDMQYKLTILQYAMLIAFPHLTGPEQLQILLANNRTDNILLDLLKVLKPLKKIIFERYLEKAIKNNNDHMLICILSFANNTNTAISKKSCNYIPLLFKSQNRLVRQKAIALIVKLDDDKLIEEFAYTDWNPKQLNSKESYNEIWFGSEAILRAAERGFISQDDAITRISHRFLGKAAKRLEGKTLIEISSRIDVAIKKVIDLELDIPIPNIEQNKPDNTANPSLYVVSDTNSTSNNPYDLYNKLCENSKTFSERQERNVAAFEIFVEKLTTINAQNILENLTIEQFDKIISKNNTLGEYWYSLIIKLPIHKLRIIHNIGLLLARQLVTNKPKNARILYNRLSQCQPLIRFTYGFESIPLDSMSIWSGPDEPHVNEIRFERLDKALDDHALSIEVLSAMKNSKYKLLQQYVDERIGTGTPSMITRAIMVCGFSLENKHASKILNEFKDTVGFIGLACKSALYAYERNIWAQKWFITMCKTESNRKFWTNSVLFLKIVDGRFGIWSKEHKFKGKPIKLFGTTINDGIKKRVKKWGGKRKKTLFGDRIPQSIFT
ncbi:MAG: hypothetical protein DHS20C13_14350 [Thermodesulfobacteriota bacterium]|nr:MAG: hypothetical protein DHS20C13_14350 [Thermodesulfobacteriota bacterium]